MPLTVSRRTLLEAAMLAPLFSAAGRAATAVPGFTHGVASGDPASDSVVLWTRYVAADSRPASLRFEIASNEAMTAIEARGTAIAGPDTDYCAHALPTGLRPGRWYYYRFTAPDGSRSAVGRTRTLPLGAVDRFRIGVMSCANATSGWFSAYAHAAARDDLDLIVHTGDYIYESPTDRSDALPALVTLRDIQPRGEAVSLADYRARYASYRRDPGLAELHRRFPMIVQWDDHEVANNSWMGGAKNHGDGEGTWPDRVAAGMRAFREWLPMRPRAYDSYTIGTLATLARIEMRLVGRSRQLDFTPPAGGALAQAVERFRNGPLADPSRTMMGPVQERWLDGVLRQSANSGVAWQILANQVILAPTRLPPVSAQWFAPGDPVSAERQADLDQAVAQADAGMPFSLDRWDGYPAARERLFDSAAAARANLVVVSGDSHNAWAYDLSHRGQYIGTELAGHSVSSLGLDKRFSGDPRLIADAFVAANPGLSWCDTSRRGYMTLDITARRIATEWLFLEARTKAAPVVLATHRKIVERNSG